MTVKHSQKAKVILCVCMLLVGIISAYALIKAFRPSAGLPYEQLTVEQAEKYMEFEGEYLLADIRSEQAYEAAHMEGAVNTPYDTLVENALTAFPDKTQMIYVYGDDDTLSGNACRKLSELGYNNITQITGVKGWIEEPDMETETELH